MNISKLKFIDWPLFATSILLLILGLSAIYSVSYSGADNLPQVFYKQALIAASGVFLMLFLAIFDYRFLKKYTAIMFLTGIVLLLILLVWKNPIRGASSWIKLGFLGFEIVEGIKLILIVILAKYLSKNMRDLDKWRHILISGFYAGIFVFLIMRQPDFGSAFIVGAIWIGMLLAAGIKYWKIFLLFLIFAFIGVLSWLFILAPYQKDRISVFLNPAGDPLKSGYNVNQSIIAIGSGGLFGKGLGVGSQSQLKFIPEAHTDFIFAVFAEEWGLLGVIFLILLFGLFFWRLLRIASKARDNFGRMIVLGVITMILTQIMINMGMNTGILPVTGIPLPFISYGGSSVLSIMIILGIIQAINIRSYEYMDRDKKWILEI